MGPNTTPQDGIHPAWLELIAHARPRGTSRRRFISSAAAGVAGLALGSCLRASLATPLAAAAAGVPDLAWWPSNSRIKHVVILCQENRSFDHYFGEFASQLGQPGHAALGFTPAALTYHDAAGNAYHPQHLTQFCDLDPDHSWEGSPARHGTAARCARGSGARRLERVELDRAVSHLR